MKSHYQRQFSLSILLWMRKDQPRKQGMDYWKGPHSKIIASSPGLFEYRQQHFSADEHSFWPKNPILETIVSDDRKIDGVAEVTYKSY
ncbi:hypothetical protein AB1I63_05455 [Streptococcus pneumoniae]